MRSNGGGECLFYGVFFLSLFACFCIVWVSVSFYLCLCLPFSVCVCLSLCLCLSLSLSLFADNNSLSPPSPYLTALFSLPRSFTLGFSPWSCFSLLLPSLVRLHHSSISASFHTFTSTPALLSHSLTAHLSLTSISHPTIFHLYPFS